MALLLFGNCLPWKRLLRIYRRNAIAIAVAQPLIHGRFLKYWLYSLGRSSRCRARYSSTNYIVLGRLLKWQPANRWTPFRATIFLARSGQFLGENHYGMALPASPHGNIYLTRSFKWLDQPTFPRAIQLFRRFLLRVLYHLLYREASWLT
jgi:hypothetical protein